MKMVLYIDGVDAFEAFGLSVSDGGYKGFACFPSLKDVAFNDWHEQNGIDPDLSAPVLNAREIVMDFHIVGGLWRYYSLIDKLSDGAYHVFKMNEIGLIKKLRLVRCGEVKSVQKIHKFSLTFSDDFPLEGYEYYGPTAAFTPRYDFSIDGKDISDYGIRMEKGTYENIVQHPDVKENLKVNISTLHGVGYDAENVTYKSRTVGLNCFMRGRSHMEFWRNWNALLYDLTRPDARVLHVSRFDKDIPFFYKSCNVQTFFPDPDKVWFEFTLNVEFFKGVI